MRKSTVIAIALGVLLVGTNGYWYFFLTKRLYGCEHTWWDLRDARLAEHTALSMLPVVAGRPLSRAEVIASLTRLGIGVPASEAEQEEFDAGGVQFVFDRDGNLVEAVELPHFRD